MKKILRIVGFLAFCSLVGVVTGGVLGLCTGYARYKYEEYKAIKRFEQIMEEQ